MNAINQETGKPYPASFKPYRVHFWSSIVHAETNERTRVATVYAEAKHAADTLFMYGSLNGAGNGFIIKEIKEIV